MPAITYGIESVLVSETTINSLDRESAKWAKETLSLPTITPNVVSQVLMGIPSFKYIIYGAQLKFHLRVRELPKKRYAHQALMENENGGWDSPYSKHIYKVRSRMGLVSFPPTESLLDELVSAHCRDELNARMETLTSLPQCETIERLERARSAREGEEWFWINLARMGGLSIKRQIEEEGRVGVCRRDGVRNTDLHCVSECRNTEAERRKTGVSQFFTCCRTRGISDKAGYAMFVSGLNIEGCPIKDEDYKERGECLAAIFKSSVIKDLL